MLNRRLWCSVAPAFWRTQVIRVTVCVRQAIRRAVMPGMLRRMADVLRGRRCQGLSLGRICHLGGTLKMNGLTQLRNGGIPPPLLRRFFQSLLGAGFTMHQK